jgi:hypothetical protein
VQQQQHITLPNCAKFSLISDGTKEGTMAVNGSRENDKTCLKVQETPTSTSGIEAAKKPSSAGQSQYAATSRPEQAKNNTESQRGMSKRILLITFLFILMMLLPGTHASPSDHHRRNELHERVDLRIRDVSDKVKAFANHRQHCRPIYLHRLSTLGF